MSVIWNSVRTVLSCPDTSFTIFYIKTKLKVFLLNKQSKEIMKIGLSTILFNNTLCSEAFLDYMFIKTKKYLSKLLSQIKHIYSKTAQSQTYLLSSCGNL